MRRGWLHDAFELLLEHISKEISAGVACLDRFRGTSWGSSLRASKVCGVNIVTEGIPEGPHVRLQSKLTLHAGVDHACATNPVNDAQGTLHTGHANIDCWPPDIV